MYLPIHTLMYLEIYLLIYPFHSTIQILTFLYLSTKIPVIIHNIATTLILPIYLTHQPLQLKLRGLTGGGEGSNTTAFGASLLPCNTSPSRRSLAKPCRDPATSTTTLSCCWISINLSFPLAGSRRRRHRCSVRVLNAEVPSVRHSVIGDLDHGEYDSINLVLLNASA